MIIFEPIIPEPAKVVIKFEQSNEVEKLKKNILPKPITEYSLILNRFVYTIFWHNLLKLHSTVYPSWKVLNCRQN